MKLKSKKEKGKNMNKFNNLKLSLRRMVFAFCLLPFTFVQAQEPKPSAPKSVSIPAVKEKKLKNGLTVAVVERKNVPLVTVSLLIRSGADSESFEKAGLANLTASLLTKGTATRSATQIAEQMEFLGGSINSGASWNNSSVTIGVMSDKLDAAMAIMADVALNPKFAQKEIDLLKSQTQDGLAYNLKQPGFLANYVAGVYSFEEHPAGGTPDSIKAIKRVDILKFKKENYNPTDAVLIFTGDISATRANALAQKFFGAWKDPVVRKKTIQIESPGIPLPISTVGNPQNQPKKSSIAKSLLVIDLPNSGQAAVNYTKPIWEDGRTVHTDSDKIESSEIFYPASVLNSVLGGGYSSRLNQEIRIKRGLSYGAGSGFAWRNFYANFGTRTQTKNESAAEVAELVLAEIQKLTETIVSEAELNPRKLVITGDFGRDLETNGGLAEAAAALYGYQLSTNELNTFMPNVQKVTAAEVREFANQYLKGGDLIIVGDYAKFKDDLAKRFPNIEPLIIKAEGLNLRKLAK
jgi:zinc protease